MVIEKLEKVLQAKGITNLNRCGDELFKRNFTFDIDDQSYRIKWYQNLMTLYSDYGWELLFDRIEACNTWSNHVKNNLQFYIRDNVIFILPIEYYKE